MSNTLRYTFTDDTMQHLDILSHENFIRQIHEFIETNKLPSSNILMILSDDLLFCKELPALSRNNSSPEEDAQGFIDAVPFDSVLSKAYRLERKELLVATNYDYFRQFEYAFNKNHSRIEDVVPLFLLGKSVNLQYGMPKDVAHVILEKLGNIKPWGMPVVQEVEPITHKDEEPVLKKKNDQVDTDTLSTSAPIRKKTKKRIYTLAASFLPLLGIFMYLFIQMNAENARETAQFQTKLHQQTIAQTQTTPAPQTIIALPTGSPSAFSATVTEQNMKVSLEYSATSASIAASIKDELTKFGIKSIQDIRATTSNNANSVLFSGNVPAGTRQRIVDELHKVIATVDIQEGNQLSSDVFITLP